MFVCAHVLFMRVSKFPTILFELKNNTFYWVILFVVLKMCFCVSQYFCVCVCVCV